MNSSLTLLFSLLALSSCLPAQAAAPMVKTQPGFYRMIRGQRLIVMGDLVLMAALQFPNPSLGSAFDSDPKSAAEQRLRVFKMAADGDYWVAGGHLSRSGQARYFWVPANFSIPFQ